MSIFKKNYPVLLFYLSLGICGFQTACRPECAQPRKNLILIQFAKKTTLVNDTLIFESIKGVNSPIDSSFVSNKVKVISFNVPVSEKSETIAYAFTYKKTDLSIRKDTLYLKYSRKLFVIKPDCGLTEEINNLEITRSTFDSAWVANRTLENKKTQADIFIVFR